MVAVRSPRNSKLDERDPPIFDLDLLEEQPHQVSLHKRLLNFWRR